MAVIGIDLGTTNSLGCVYRNGKTELIPNAYGSYLTPSVVSMTEDGKLIVGQPAKDRLITHPERTVSSFKKDMGTGRSWKPGEKSFLPEELSSLVIRSIVEDAQNYLGEEIEEAVISVPAYFHDEQRVAVKRAGALAGIHVERIVNEPSAAALASYFTANEEQNMLVFDFGGGTLDVSLVDCFDTMVEIVSVAGNNRLGGDDFDRLIAEHFLREHGVARQQLRAQEYAVLLKQAERCKKLLSEQDEVVMHATVGDQLYESTYTMDRLFEQSKALLKEIRQVIGRALKDGKMTIHDVDLVVMAGGSSKMPLIQKYIRHLFHKAPMVQGNCDELIALGLGLVCGVKERKEEIKDYILTDICPFSLGVATINEADLPHFYELFALWSDECDRPFWHAAAAASRQYLRKACHVRTGLSAEYAEYDGRPHRGDQPDRHDWFFSDAYRTLGNIALDAQWFGDKDGWAQETAAHIQQFFEEKEHGQTSGIYLIDGTPVEGNALHPVGLLATIAQGSLILDDACADEWLRRFFSTPLRSGPRRYYDNCLYLFALLALSGHYRIWFPQEATV